MVKAVMGKRPPTLRRTREIGSPRSLRTWFVALRRATYTHEAPPEDWAPLPGQHFIPPRSMPIVPPHTWSDHQGGLISSRAAGIIIRPRSNSRSPLEKGKVQVCGPPFSRGRTAYNSFSRVMGGSHLCII